MAVPIIDIFAGPGGLGEGFSALKDSHGDRAFKIVLSIEKDISAHTTLTLRSFFRQFEIGKAPEDYYEFVRGKISLEDLYKKWPVQALAAKEEAWLATLGSKKGATPHEEIDSRIRLSLKGKKNWVLIGGPPCQAYSVIGRVRRKRKTLNEKADERVGLYKEYLRILAIHNPSVFVMENVRGLLTAKTKDSPVFTNILRDLADPVAAYQIDFKANDKLSCPGYKIYSLVKKSKEFAADGQPILDPQDYLIKTEDHGVPQTRHRVILLGIRNDIKAVPDTIEEKDEISVAEVISGLPKIRSSVSRAKDNPQKWKEAVMSIGKGGELKNCDADIRKLISEQVQNVSLPLLGAGKEFIGSDTLEIAYQKSWFFDKRLKGVCNHTARSHMKADLHRYFFAACFAKKLKRSPTLEDFPVALLPTHRNVKNEDGSITRKFADRFKVQIKENPSKTITSHISQDGHYYIHYDPTQCRSFTVREAARIQTFPDNYYFCGPRTSQFIQVGNAVPPLLAHQIAGVVKKIVLPDNSKH